MKKVYFFLAFIVIILFGGTFAYDGMKVYFVKKFFSKPMVRVVTISTTKVTQQDWQPYLHAIGTVVANKGVDVSPRTAGVVSKILFKSGQWVKQGQQLLQLDDATDLQILASDLVTLRIDQRAYQRKLEIAQRTPSVSQSDLESSKATVDIQRNKVAQDRLNIVHKKVLAPFAGKLGIRQVDLGQYLQPGTDVVTLQDLRLVHVDFNLSQEDVAKVHQNQKVELNSTAYPDQKFIGSIKAISPQLDANTRTVKIRATFNNPKSLLLPGQFAVLNVFLPLEKKVLTVPMTAITFTLYGNTVYVVDSKKTDGKSQLIARTVPVKVGQRRGNIAVIEQGLKLSDQVVISGQLKLHDGSEIQINNL